MEKCSFCVFSYTYILPIQLIGVKIEICKTNITFINTEGPHFNFLCQRSTSATQDSESS